MPSTPFRLLLEHITHTRITPHIIPSRDCRIPWKNEKLNTLLLIDDSAGVRVLVTRIISYHSYDIQRATVHPSLLRAVR